MHRFPQYVANQKALSEVCQLLQGWGDARIVVPDAMFTGILANIMNPTDWGAECRERDEFELFTGVTIIRQSSTPDVREDQGGEA